MSATRFIEFTDKKVTRFVNVSLIKIASFNDEKELRIFMQGDQVKHKITENAEIQRALEILRS